MNAMIALLLALSTQDAIRFKDPARNPDLEGDVVSMTSKSVELEVVVDGVRIKRTVDARDVAEILPRKSLDFTMAEEALANGDLAAAVQRFERAAADPSAGEALRQSAAIRIVRAQAAADNDGAAVLASRALRARNPDSFYVGESYRAEVAARLASRELKQAEATIKAFLALGNAQAAPDWIRDGELLEARLLEHQANPRGALAAYRKHAKDPEVTEAVALGEMRCLTAIGDWPGLRKRADGVIKDSSAKKNSDPRPLIAAYAGRGDLAMNDGKPKEALLNYLRGAVVLHRGEKSAEHEAALARGSIACARLAAAETSRESRELHRGRAQELLRELASTYPRSTLLAEVDRRIRETR